LKGRWGAGMVLMGVAVMDDCLWAKVARIRSLGSNEARSRLLDAPLGALSGFMSRVDFSYCIGLYNHQLYEDIRLLNRLRNKCAHEWQEFRIDDEVVNRYARPMHMWHLTDAVVELFRKQADRIMTPR